MALTANSGMNIYVALHFPNFFTAGPKLYKEPSAKSNKHIIQNALAHCCLAGKVNEGQKNKILEVRLAFGFIHLVLEFEIYVEMFFISRKCLGILPG